MKLGQPSFENEPWTQLGEDSFLSPSLTGSWEQIMLFPEHKGSDYTITVRLTLQEGERTDNFQYKEAGVVFRYNDLNRFYYAGVGGFGARRFISLVQNNNGQRAWHFLSKEGDRASVAFAQPWELRIECLGPRIQLFAGTHLVLSADDASYKTGYWGFRTVRTQALFEEVKSSPARKPRCFVVMPFSAPFNFVYSAIREEAEENGYRCEREDERSLAQTIVEDVKAQVASADLIIADLSNANPNVYYEVGLAHSLGKKVILLAQSVEDVTFDLRHIRYELYATPQQLREKLRDAIRQLAAEALI